MSLEIIWDDGRVMNLGINATVIDEKPTGVGVYSINIIRQLDLLAESLTVWVTERGLLADVIVNAGLIESSPHLPVRIRKNSLFRALWDQLLLPFEIKKVGVDVIFFPVQEGMIVPPVPQVVFVHDLAPLNYPDGVPLLRRLSYFLRIPVVLKKSSAITVPTEFVKEELLRRFRGLDSSKIHVVGEGYDTAHFKPISNPSRIVPSKYILFVGSRCKNKNLKRIIEAFSLFGKSGWSLILAGKPLDMEYAECLREFAFQKGVAQSVLFLDYVPYEQLPHLYSGAEMFLFPSLYEGFGLPIIEAMACGAPVITSNCSSMSEVAGGAAILVDPYSVESILAAMKEIAENPECAVSLKRAGLERAEQFSWENSAKELLKVLRAVS